MFNVLPDLSHGLMTAPLAAKPVVKRALHEEPYSCFAGRDCCNF
jgi:hypothetical protein